MITAEAPRDWRALQEEVARILDEAGMAVEVEKPVSTARGTVNVDVYAEEKVKGRRYVLLTECKNWARRVPQHVIHAFRTVVAESGANVGYIVSSGGFQSGALTAAELTNLRLVTWPEFQDDFEETWIENHLLPTVWERLDPLFSYTEPLVPRSFIEVDDAAVERLKALREQYCEFGWLMMTFTSIMHDFLDKRGDTRGVPTLPLRTRASKDLEASAPDSVLDALGYREFLTAALAYGETAIREFREAVAEGQRSKS
jgi:restriction system protein